VSLSVKNLTVTLGKNLILRDINLDIPRGSFFSLLGPSGCGKSTLLKTIAGLIRQDSGHISWNGEAIDDLPPEKRGMVMVFQDLRLFPHMTLLDNVAFTLKMAGTKKADRYNTAHHMLELVQLDTLESRRPHQLSGGQQQRAALARALAASPHVLLLDEPLSSLDPPLRADMLELIWLLRKKLGTTMVLVTHDKEEALAVSDTMAVMAKGCVLQTGAPQDIYRSPNCLAVAQHFFRGNRIEGRIIEGRFEGGGLSFILPRPHEDGKVIALFPPESMSLEPGTGDFTVSRLEYAGSHLKATITNGDIYLHVHLPPDQSGILHSHTGITIDTNQILLFPC
jgi:ABC-type Fe3+/spermidine/putrescine transport system ATPase subunit